MQQLASVAEGQPIRPSSMAANAISGSFEVALCSVDAEQHKASAAMAAVDSGKATIWSAR